MSNDTLRVTLAPLTDGNWVAWSMKFEAYLIRRGLWSVVDVHPDPSATDPAADLAAKLAARPNDKLEAARSEFVLHVDDSQLAHMRSRDPYEIWNNLKQVHLSSGLATSLERRRQFLTAKKLQSQTMQSWIGDTKTRAFLMEEAGIVVSDQDKILAVTLGLPASYDSFIITLDATPADQLTFASVVTRLMNEESRQQSGAGTGMPAASGTGDEALAVTSVRTRSSAPRTAPRPVSDITCHFCDEKGHYKSDCSLKKLFQKWLASQMANDTSAAVEEIGEAWSSDEAF